MAQSTKRGFAAMDPERQRQIAREGGRAAHESGHAHEWNAEAAARAGHRAHQLGRAHEWTSEEAARAGRKGGVAASQQRKNARRLAEAAAARNEAAAENEQPQSEAPHADAQEEPETTVRERKNIEDQPQQR